MFIKSEGFRFITLRYALATQSVSTQSDRIVASVKKALRNNTMKTRPVSTSMNVPKFRAYAANAASTIGDRTNAHVKLATV